MGLTYVWTTACPLHGPCSNSQPLAWLGLSPLEPPLADDIQVSFSLLPHKHLTTVFRVVPCHTNTLFLFPYTMQWALFERFPGLPSSFTDRC